MMNMTRNVKGSRLKGGRYLATLMVVVLLGVSLRNSFSFANILVTNTNDSGAGSLRQAIIDANAAPGSTIVFNIPTSDPNFSGGVFTIQPTSALPTITADGTVIDGTTQTAFTGDTNTSGPEVVLNGASAGFGANGVSITVRNCVVKGLVINGFTRDGVNLFGATATGNQVQGCYIGTNATGTAAVSNTGSGVYMGVGAANNIVGGTTAAQRNVLSGNIGNGVLMELSGTDNNVVRGNYIGVNAAGTAAILNRSGGVNILTNSQNNTIGGTAAGAGNLISGNEGRGINIASNNNVVQGNYIGVNAAGTAAIPNTLQGVLIQSTAQGNLVGGTTAGARNVISGNGDAGVWITAASNTLQGNTIGVNAAGTAAIANSLSGVNVSGNSNTIGGAAAGAGNLISGNTGAGIQCSGIGNVIQGNSIGTNAAGTAGLANTGSGVDVTNRSNTIGGTAAGAGNLIAFNALDGVRVSGNTTAGVTIRGNAIFSNTGLGIDLGGNGVTANDAGDGDSGPNNLQNYPVLSSPVTSGGNTMIQGTLNSNASTNFAIDFYSNSSAGRDPSGFGEGEVYIGSVNVTTDASGNANIVVTINSDNTFRFITATATNLGTNDTSEFSLARQAQPAPPTQLAFTLQPSNAVAGVAISPAVQVTLLDQFGNPAIYAIDLVSVSIGSNPGGGTLSGSITQSPVNGVATFNDLSIDKAGTGYTLTASSGTLTGATSTTFNITPAAPAKLAFTQQPSNTTAGVAIAPAVQVAVQDQFGNTVPTANDSITVAIGANPGGGTLSGTLMRNAVNGVATFNDLRIDKAGTGYTLTASAANRTGATSATFDITAGAAAKLAFVTQPSNTRANTVIAPAVQVAVQDQFGNTVPTANNSVTVAIGNNPSGGVLSGTRTLNAVNGVATFANLSIDRIGVGYTLTAVDSGLTPATSAAFNVTASRLAFTQQPSNTTAGASITPAVQVTAQDSFGTTDTTFNANVTVAIGNNPGGGTLSGTLTRSAVNGVATFDDLKINKTGTGYTLTAVDSGLTPATSAAFNVTPDVPAKLAFTVQPTTARTDIPISPAVQVAVLDQFDNLVPTATNSITMGIGANPGGGTLSGTLTRNAVNGMATFNDLSINRVGNGYTLAASSMGLTGATSNPFNVTILFLAFTVQPTNTQAGAFISPALKVEVRDQSGNLIPTAADSITIAIGNNPSGGTLFGTRTRSAVNGVATFNDLSIDKVGNGYTLTASGLGLMSTTSNAFNVSVGTAAQLAFSVQPTNTTAGGIITPSVKVAVQDRFSNFVPTATDSITVAIGNNPGGSGLAGVKTVSAVNGVATFHNLSMDRAGSGYTLTASAAGLINANSAPFDILLSTASAAVFITQPISTAGGAPIAPAVKVAIQDPFGNVITNATNSITITMGNNPSGGALFGMTTLNAVNGVATFSDLRLDKAGTGYTLHAAASGLAETNSAAFDVTSNESVPPTLSNQNVTPPNLPPDGGTVTLSVDATDNVKVQSVWAEVTKPDGSKETVNLMPGSNTYRGTFNALKNITIAAQTYRAVFFARDNAGNPATPTQPIDFTVAAGPDKTEPTLSNPKVTPNNVGENGGAVTLNVDVTDNVGVTSVWAKVTKDTTEETVNLTSQSGNTYMGTFTAPASSACDTQTYKVKYFAKDAAGNEGGPTSEVDFTVTGKTTPFTLAGASINKTNLPATGGDVTITATLNGCQGAVTLVATVTTGKGRKAQTVATIVLTQQNQTIYTGTFNAPANTKKKAITYTIKVSLNNAAPVTTGSVTVAGKGKAQSVLVPSRDGDGAKAAHTPLTLRLLSTAGGKSGTATLFTFTLNRPAQVTARVLSPTGKAVRQFSAQPATEGLNTLLWDGKAQTGGGVARGLYLIEIIAQDEKGQAARVARMVVVR